MRLLVVEDQKDLNEIIVRKLTNEHYSVDACYTGNDALDFIRCAEYDGIILDIMLPGITGIGVLREMRASGNNTPVLLLTAMGYSRGSCRRPGRRSRRLSCETF